MDKIPMTPAGHAALEVELKTLKSQERPNIIKAIAEAREHGDLSENAEYHSAREKQSFIEGRIKELEGIISLARALIGKDVGDSVEVRTPGGEKAYEILDIVYA
ncbi:MAG: transcription elongation factor GreA [Rhodobacteraceae bacterium]|nr:transcription elongation factor GreA [Paracoccaceae bacterium]